MPAPAVYVLAIVGTVGAVLAFKEFVYEPHIAPAIDRWKAEYQAAREARRRRQTMNVIQDQEMSEAPRRTKGKFHDKYSDDEGSDNEDYGKRATTSSHSFLRDGLLIKRPAMSTKDNGDVHLENLVAHEVNEWRNQATGQVLRHRKNVSEYAMEESIQPIPYTPLSPSRTHVIADSFAPSPSTPAYSRLPSPPPAVHSSRTDLMKSSGPTALIPSMGNVGSGLNKQEMSINKSSPPPHLSFSLPPSDITELVKVSSPPPEVSPFQHTVTQSTLLIQSAPPLSVDHAPTHPYPHLVPSLSQSYPQDLDYEHDLELLSPPSSRAESPFSMAALSPNHQVPGRASPLGPEISSVVSSPSMLRMGLGNDSFDAISPIPHFQALSPFVDPLAHGGANPLTAVANPSAHPTPSTQSTAFLSFSDASDDENLAQPYAHLGGVGASTGAGGLGLTPSTESQPMLHYHQPAALHPSLVHGPYSTSPAPRDTSRIVAPTMSRRTSGSGNGSKGPTPARGQRASPVASASGSTAGGALGLRLFPVPVRPPYTPAPPAEPVRTVALPAGTRDPAYFRPSSVAGARVRAQAEARSDSELSDLEFISDYAPSESDLGDESDASWGVLGSTRR